MTYSSRTSMMSCGVGTPSRDLTIEDLFSSRMISMQSSTHSSQMNTVGPAISLRTSCWLLPQNEQYRVFLESPPLLPLTLLISLSFQALRSPAAGRGPLTRRHEYHAGQRASFAWGTLPFRTSIPIGGNETP